MVGVLVDGREIGLIELVDRLRDDAGRAAAAAITDNDAWKAERPGQMKIAREGLVAAIKGIIE